MTRWLVVVLLAANLAFMAWMYQRMASDPAARPPQAGPAREGGELRLLSEVAPATDEATPVAADAAPVPPEPGADEATVAEDFIAVVPGPWTGSAAPAGADEAPPAWRALEQLAVVAPVEPPAAVPAAVPAVEPLAALADDDDGEAPEPAATGVTNEAAPADIAAAEPAPVAPAAVPVAATDTCLTLGPLAAEASAQRLSDWLVDRGGTAVMRPEITGRPDAHWLYVGPFPDLNAARLESDRLRDLGVTDHLAVRHEQLGPVVSLGLYSTREGRERRIRTLQESGVEPVVVPRGPREVRWWVDARLPPESGLTAAAITVAAAGSGEVAASPCEPGVATGAGKEAPLTIGAAPAAPAE